MERLQCVSETSTECFYEAATSAWIERTKGVPDADLGNESETRTPLVPNADPFVPDADHFVPDADLCNVQRACKEFHHHFTWNRNQCLERANEPSAGRRPGHTWATSLQRGCNKSWRRTNRLLDSD